MRSRILLAVIVLGAIVVWARCKFDPQVVVPAPPNSFFLGCFTGPISDAGITGSVTIVLEAPVDSTDQFTLGGCIRSEAQPKPPVIAMLSGSVEQAIRERALVTAVPAGGGSPFSLRILREPAGETVADQIDVDNAGGAPFQQAADLPRCAPQLTCPLLAASMQPEPEPVLELP